MHLVLTGPGGGTWDVAVGQEADGQGPGQDVVIVTDAVGFCRLAANRTTPAELAPHVTGMPCARRSAGRGVDAGPGLTGP